MSRAVTGDPDASIKAFMVLERELRGKFSKEPTVINEVNNTRALYDYAHKHNLQDQNLSALSLELNRRIVTFEHTYPSSDAFASLLRKIRTSTGTPNTKSVQEMCALLERAKAGAWEERGALCSPELRSAALSQIEFVMQVYLKVMSSDSSAPYIISLSETQLDAIYAKLRQIFETMLTQLELTAAPSCA